MIDWMFPHNLFGHYSSMMSNFHGICLGNGDYSVMYIFCLSNMQLVLLGYILPAVRNDAWMSKMDFSFTKLKSYDCPASYS